MPQAQKQGDPWEEAAKDFKSNTPAPQAGRAISGTPPATDDWKIWSADKSDAATPPPSSWLDTVKSWLPSRRTALQTGGAMVGGVLGLPAGGPFGAAAGGALGAGAGESVDRLIRGLPPQSLNESAGEMGHAMTMGAAQEGVGAVLPGLARGAARGLYRNALKPSTTLTADAANDLVNTGLRERLPVSEKGVGKLNRTVSGINDQIDTAIAAKPGAEVSPFKVAGRVDPTISDFKYKDLQRDAGAAAGEKQRFITEHSTPTSYSPYPPPHQPSLSFPVEPQTYARENPILAPRAQSMKKAIWQELAPNDFGTVAEGYKQARKAEGMGLKGELEQHFPEIQGLNAREGSLLELRPQLSRAANRIANNNSVGIDAPLTAGAMQAVTGSQPLSIAAALAKALPGSRTAILLNRLAGSSARIPGIARMTAGGVRNGLSGGQ